MKREKRSGQLPVDFLVGFTIFILSLIMVANYVPSLLVGLQRTSGIDYDAVAYRTGVVLVEDPGEPPGLSPVGSAPPPVPPPHPQWDLQTYGEKDFVNRFGLALTRDTPNILSINKIERFFNSSFANPGLFFFNDTDYRNKLIFSSYQYGYNVTLQNISPMKSTDYPQGLKRMLGGPYPAGYGYIRRYVVIKQNSNASIDMDAFGADQGIQYTFTASREDQVDLHCYPWDNPCKYDPIPHQQFIIRFDHGILYNKSIETHLKIDLQREPISLKITNLSSCLNNSATNLRYTKGMENIANDSTKWGSNNPVFCDYKQGGLCLAPRNATLTSVKFFDPSTGDEWTDFLRGVNLTVDGDHVDFPVPPRIPGVNDVFVDDTIELYVSYIEPFYLNDGRPLDIIFTFQNTLPHTHVTGTFLYDYNRRNVTQPVLSTGMLEVAIW
jgi:hypothetical protein